MVLGDTMVDTYVFGHVSRMSPEAPVPVVVQDKVEQRLGGAANVALNLKSLGSDVILTSVIGADMNGELIMKLLSENDLTTEFVVNDKSRVTSEKRRVIDGTSQVVRIDTENTSPISQELTRLLLGKVLSILPEIDVLIFQDYDKGVLTANLIEKVISQCKNLSIPVVVDPKERNYFSYKGATLFKPNLREFEKAHQITIDLENIEDLKKKARDACYELQCNILLLTLSAHGLLIVDKQNFEWVPAAKIELKNVLGAGDTVVAVAALCLAIGLSIPIIGQLANEAGALVCEQYGVVPVEKNKLIKRGEQHFSLQTSSFG